MGHTKRRRINHNCYCFLIGIHPHLQAIGVECAVRVFPTPEEGDPRFKLPKSRHKKIAVAAFVEHMALEKTFQSSLLCRRVFFSSEKNRSILGRYSESRHPQIHLLLNPLAALRKVLQGLEAYIEGGQNCNISDSRNAFEIYCDLP